MIVAQRGQDRLSQCDGASLNWIGGEFVALDPDFRKDIERMFDEIAIGIFEMSFNESVVDFVQSARQLFAILAAPFLAADQAADLAASKRNFLRHRTAIA